MGLLALNPRVPRVLRQALEDRHLLTRRDAREVLRRLVDSGQVSLGWDGLLYSVDTPGPGRRLELRS